MNGMKKESTQYKKNLGLHKHLINDYDKTLSFKDT